MCFCQPIFSMISARVAPFLRRSMVITWAVLLPGRGAAADVDARVLACLAFLAEAVFRLAAALVGATRGARTPALAISRAAFIDPAER